MICINEIDLKRLGFNKPDHDGVFWKWHGHYGVKIEDDKFIPCDMFDNGVLQYADKSFDKFEDAATYASNYFT